MEPRSYISRSAWRPLRQKDRVGFCMPSSKPNPASMQYFTEAMRGFDLVPVMPRDLLEGSCPVWGNSADKRLQHLVGLLNDDNVKAIFLPGGAGGDEMVELLERYDLEYGIARSGKPIIGFSDATTIMNYLAQRGIASPILGPDISRLFSKKKISYFRENQQDKYQATHDAFRQLLMGGSYTSFKAKPVNEAAILRRDIKGRAAIYNSHHNRSLYRLSPTKDRDNIIFIEGGKTHAGSAVPGLLQAIKYFKENGSLHKIKAFVISYTDADFDKDGKSTDLDAIKDAVKDLDIPVFFGAPFGHMRKLMPSSFLPMGSEMSISRNVREEDAEVFMHRAMKVSDMMKAERQWERKQHICLEPLRMPKRHNVVYKVGRKADGSPIMDLADFDLSGHSICLHFDSYEKLVSNDRMDKMTPSQIEEGKARYYINNMQMALMELVKSDQMSSLKGLTIAVDVKLPDQVKTWLSGFRDRFCSHCHVRTIIANESDIGLSEDMKMTSLPATAYRHKIDMAIAPKGSRFHYMEPTASSSARTSPSVYR